MPDVEMNWRRWCAAWAQTRLGLALKDHPANPEADGYVAMSAMMAALNHPEFATAWRDLLVGAVEDDTEYIEAMEAAVLALVASLRRPR